MYNETMSRIYIEELHKITEPEIPALFGTFREAFSAYPKLDGVFPDPRDKALAVEMVVEFYGRFDMKFGAAYSLDSDISDGVVLVDSRNLIYSEENLAAAGGESERFCALARELGPAGVERWNAFFDELDRQEKLLDLPEEYIYVDFLAVDPRRQGEGRGRKLIEAVCRKAKEENLPVMLFTNGDDDVRFYENRGFEVAGITESAELGMKNVYMLYDV
ncbi:MAG: GNAT family N-acetyltransferase [Firmicutes bacterium]|nr:GNAT family N-acetyltransferase [Bacillota bacterium]